MLILQISQNCSWKLKGTVSTNQISIVFGCGEIRDKSKRFLMGKIADKFCNNIYLTDDNPRNENLNL